MDSLSLLTNGYVSTVKRIVQQVPLLPAEAQSLLVKSLELPLPANITTEVTGIHQSDVIIRSALVMAIADLRSKPWLLDYVFASLPKDSITNAEYGEKEVAAAKKWFTSTNIPVFMSTRTDESKIPAISIQLLESTEAENTFSDTHYQVQEDNSAVWPDLTTAFSPVSYSAATGYMVLPEGVTKELIVAPGMNVIDSIGRAFEVLEVVDDNTIAIKPGTVADFSKAVIKSMKPSHVTKLESVTMKESYSIGCHAGQDFQLTYLHSIVTFILFRYKESLLEARGFERSSLASSDFRRNDMFDPEQVFSRHIQITGYVRQMWPKAIEPRVTASILAPLIASEPGNDSEIEEVETELDLDQDSLVVKTKK